MNQAHHPQKTSIKSIISLCLISTVLSQALPAYAQIIPDNTLSSEASQLKQNLIINGALGDKIDGGAIRGSNLFHSFSEFNIENGQRVYFGNPTGIENILTRVTGGNASNIFGTLGVNGAANLFLINPNGILFGENARLDVQGSFVGTTANGVQFGNQGIFSATNPKAPPLLTIRPSALWFNQLNQGAAIQNNSIARAGTDPAGFNASGLRVADGKSLLLVGGNVSMDGGELNAYGGRVELGGLAAPGNVNLLFNGDNLSLKFPENVTRADVSLINEAFVYVEAAGGGDIAINARNIDILGGSQLNAGIAEGLGQPEATAGDITLNATGEIKVADSGSRIRNLVREDSKGNGGNITIDSGDFSLSDDARLSASTYGQGNAGNVTVGAKNAISLTGGNIFSTVEAGGVGKGGNIDINAATLSLTDGAQLLTSTRSASATQPAGRGDAGNVNVLVTGAVDIAGEKNGFSSGIRSNVETGTVGNGGNIIIDSGSFSLSDGAQLQASTYGEGNAGNVNLLVTGAVDIAGEKNDVTSGIRSLVGTGTVGNGGNIIIDSGSFSLSDGAQLSASTYGQGNAGNVTVGAKNAVDLANGDILSAVEAGGVGKGGNIDINAATLSLTDGAQLLTITRRASATQPAGRGDAGNVNILVTGAVDIAGEKNDFSSGIRSNVGTGTVGNGGNIFIDSGSFSLRDGAQLVASTFGQGDAGNVNIKVTGAVDIVGEKNGFLSGIRSLVGTGTVGNGGNITIDSGDFSLSDGAQLSASTYGQGNAGNVTVGAKDAISLAGNAYIFSTVEAGGVGKGGNININAATLSLTDGAQLLTATLKASATQPAGQGNAGNVNVLVTGAVDIAGEKNDFPSAIFTDVETGARGNGGNINISSGSFSLTDGAKLVASTGGQGLDSPNSQAGNITLNTTAKVEVAGENSSIRSTLLAGGVGNGGNITIDSSDFSLSDGAELNASTYGQGNAGNVTVGAKDAISLAGGDIFSNVGRGGVGNSGGINITGSSFSLTDGALLSASISGQGNAGNIIILAKDKVSFSGTNSGVLGAVDSLGIGNGANINIRARSLSLANGALIATSTLGKGSAGNIQINADDSVFVSNGSVIQAVTFGQGNSGSITIEAGNTISFDGVGSNNLTGAYSAIGPFAIPSPEFTGKRSGGDITITAERVSLSNGAQLEASTYGQGNAGNVTVAAKDAISLVGGNIFSNVETGGVGNSGGINIRGSSLSLTNGAQLQSGIRGADTDEVAGRGNGGSVDINVTGAVTISGRKEGSASAIFTDVGTGARGNGGNINISSGSFFLADGAKLVASTSGQGLDSLNSQAGNITLNTTGKVEVAGADSAIRSTLLTGGVGNGGNITIDSGDFSLSNGAKLVASTSGQGNAGNVTVGVKDTVSLAGGDIFSNVETGGVGNSGGINIRGSSLSLTDGAQLQSGIRKADTDEVAGRGNGGSVDINVTGAVTISGRKEGNASAIFTDVGTGARGNGGNINISSGSFFLTDGAKLVASTSGQGNAGNVTVGAKDTISLAGGDIFSAIEAGGVGKGGNIDINAATLSLTDGAQLLTITRGASATQPAGRGDAGNVNLKVTGAVDITGEKNGFPSGIFSNVGTGTVGNGGNIFIDSGDFSLGDGAQLSTSTFGQGNAGNVTVGAKNAISLAGAYIFSTVSAGGVGNSGGIDIRGSSLSLTDGAQLQSGIRGADTDLVAGQGNGGSIDIDLTGALTISGTKGEFASAIFTNVETGARGNGGNINISSGSFSLSDGARLVASTGGQGLDSLNSQAGNITLNTTGKIEVAGADSAIRSTLLTGGVGNGGNIFIDSGDFSLRDEAQLSASTYGQGNAGNVTVDAKNAISLAGAYIFSTVSAGGVGKGGNIDINATTLSLTDGAQLLTATREASATQPAGRGDAGNVNVKVTGAVDIAGEKNDFPSGIRSNVETGTVGDGGNIFIDSGDFSLSDGAKLVASTSGQGNAGNVTVGAKNAISLAGGNIFSAVEAGGVGKGGNIDINAATLSLTDGAQLLTITRGASATQPAGRGNAGNVNVKVTAAVDIAGEKNGFPSGIRTLVDTETVGNGGNITIDSGDLSLSDGAFLAASTFGQGNAGNVTVSTKNAVDLANAGILSLVGVGGVGKGGNIDINAATLSLTDGAFLEASTYGQGNAGNVTVGAKNAVDLANAGILSLVGAGGVGKGGNIEINSPKITLDNQSGLTAETASGNGGNIKINSDLLLLRHNSQISTSAGTEKLGGDGGNININSKFIVAVPEENSDISANAFTGSGGNIQINSQGIFGIESRPKLTEKSDITASSELGVSGVTNINTPDNSSIQNSFTGLSPNVIDTNALIANSCISRSTKRQENSFNITGSGALRYTPGDVLTSAYTTGDVRSIEPTPRPWKKGDPIIEPQGLYRLPNGQLILSRSCSK